MDFQKILLVAGGGALGAVLRFIIAQLMKNNISYEFPWHTFLVNISGCLLIGFAWGYLSSSQAPEWISFLLVTGILGGYTTFSSFGIEFVIMLNNGKIAEAFLYVGATNMIGLLLTFVGYKSTFRSAT